MVGHQAFNEQKDWPICSKYGQYVLNGTLCATVAAIARAMLARSQSSNVSIWTGRPRASNSGLNTYTATSHRLANHHVNDFRRKSWCPHSSKMGGVPVEVMSAPPLKDQFKGVSIKQSLTAWGSSMWVSLGLWPVFNSSADVA